MTNTIDQDFIDDANAACVAIYGAEYSIKHPIIEEVLVMGMLAKFAQLQRERQAQPQSVKDALEQAAKICEENAKEFNDPFQSNRCAKAIRALIQTEED